MKKVFLLCTLTMLMVGVFAVNALGVTMRASTPPTFDGTYSNRSFRVSTITLTEDRANELTNGDTLVLVLPEGAVWDQDNTKIYRYADDRLDYMVQEGTEYKYDSDRKLKFTFKNTSGNRETFEIQAYVKFFNYKQPILTLGLWQTSLGSFSPEEVTIADNKDQDQNKSITISVEEDPVNVVVGDKYKVLGSIRIGETSMNCFKEDNRIEMTILNEGVYFDDNKNRVPYYYPIAFERLSGTNIFNSAVVESKKTAGIQIDKRSESAAVIKVNFRSISVDEKAEPGDIVVRVKAGNKTEEVVIGRILPKSDAQIAQETIKAAQAAALKPQIGRSVFKLNSLQYAFIDQNYIMTAAPYSRNGVSYVSASVLAKVLGVTDSNYIWNVTENKLTLKGAKRTLVMSVGSKNASLNGESFVLNSAPEVSGMTIMLPLREMADIFGYSVTWVQNTKSIVLDPKVYE